jgi:hypothetical protein
MPSKLDRLLDSIDPSRSFDEVSARVDQAVNDFTMRTSTITDWSAYQIFLADFLRHVESVVLRLGAGAPDDREIYWSRCSNILDEEFGPSGFKMAFEMVRTGKEGGLYRVLKTLAEKMVDYYVQNEIHGRVNKYLEQLTVEEQLAAADEYLSKYGHLLPSEFTAGNAALLRAHFAKVLTEHPGIMRRMRRIGR